MNLIDKIALVGQRMKSEQISLKESLLVSSRVSVSDDSVDGVDRLIYNHCLNKKNLSDFFGKSRVTFNKILADLEEKGVVGAPIYQNKNHLYTRWDVQKIMDALGFPRYSYYYHSRTIVTQNHKGGTGKSTTSGALAVAAALDLQLNARILLIEWDPQGSIGSGMIQSVADDDVFLTAVDAILGVYEEDSDYKNYLNLGYSEEEIIESMPFSTHLPNLDVITAFPTDARFKDKYWQCSREERTELLLRFKEVILPVLKKKYDLIIIDTPPEDSPLTWAADEAADGILVAVSPREYDYASTTDFMLTLSERFKQSPSKGENLKWFKVLAVNVDDKSPYEKIVLDKLVRTVQELFMSANIKNSEAFKAAASRGRTVLDIKKSEELCSPKQLDVAEESVMAVYQQFINEIKSFSAKERGNA
ncbi:ParA family protein [Escherichia coli]|uniref:ParA family protein n=1 Tax=Escherichia coli TaxID=562 RepID=UPI0017D59078|nr:ParA family protein [Escherichia coli]EFH7157289.1 AAA family ATPase [Escherichia coli]EIK8055593.1 ParA family protein [Escherichia coli]HDD9218211.1 ParA family protein [Escherichia coli]